MSNEKQIELTLKEAREEKAVYDALQRLRKNRDFKKIIEDIYFEKEAIRLVHLMGDGNFQSEEAQEHIRNSMKGIGELKSFLQAILIRGAEIEETIESYEAELAMLQQEGE